MARSDPLREARSDPTLSQFEVPDFPGFFSLSVRPSARPVNIASQIASAVDFVQGALSIGLIGRDRPLLVVGAGASGVAAAMTASQHVCVRLRETSSLPFTLQAKCNTRWLHPNQYDWPQAWFDDPGFPRVGGRSRPLPWTADYASAIAQGWRRQFETFENEAKDFEAWFNAPPLPEVDDPLAVTTACNIEIPTGRLVAFGAYLFCRGFAEEDVTIRKYSGYQFWQTDPIEEPSLGLPKNLPPRVLISGAGDGGLQDLLRFAFAGKRPVDLISLIADEMSKSAHADAWKAFCDGVQIFVPKGYTAPKISGPGDPSLTFVKSLPTDCLNRIFSLLEREVTFDFTGGSLQLVCPETFLVPSFALNRTLVRFLDAFVKDHLRVKAPLIRLGQRITNIIGQGGHVCNNDPVQCYGESHSCKVGTEETEFNVLVVRHGFVRETRLLEASAPSTTGARRAR